MEAQVSPAAVAAQRRAAGVKLQAIAGTLNGITPYGVRDGVNITSHLQFLSEKERAMLDKVAEHIDACQRTLLRLGDKLRGE